MCIHTDTSTSSGKEEVLVSVMWGAAQALSPEGGEALSAGDGELLTSFKYLLLALDHGLPSNKGKAVFHRSVRQFDGLADKVPFGQFSGLAVAKRIQAPPILAVSRRAFGFDHRESQNGPYYTKKYKALKAKLLGE